MAEVVAVDDVADDRVADYRDLTDAQLRRRRDAAAGGAPAAGPGMFVVEGVLAIRALLRSAYPVRSLLLAPPQLEVLGPELGGIDGPVFVAPRPVLAGITGYDVHRGALAAAGRLPPAPLAATVAGAALVAVVEEVSDQENLGALFRNAAAFGVGAVLLAPRASDPLSRRAVRVSLGHVLHVPWTRLADWPGPLDDLRAAGYTVVALTPAAGAVPIDAFEPGPRVALLFGAEGPGLSAAARAAADVEVRIPLAAGVDSLNVATAAAIAFDHLTSWEDR